MLGEVRCAEVVAIVPSIPSLEQVIDVQGRLLPTRIPKDYIRLDVIVEGNGMIIDFSLLGLTLGSQAAC